MLSDQCFEGGKATVIQLTDKSHCSGCGACASACPGNCIRMIRDAEGFQYPQIDKEKCADCGLCERVCPIINKRPDTDRLPSSIVSASTDALTRKRSTSGGFFPELAKAVLREKGVVFGVKYDARFQPVHCVIESEVELGQLCRSKYIQSDTGDTFAQVKQYINKGKKVLYSGTPCQIAGLKSYIGKEYNNLIACDVVCRGVISPRLWQKHLDELVKRYASQISYVGFREKETSFHKTKLQIHFENGKRYMPSTNIEWISRFFSAGICLRPSCYNCAFRGYDRTSDFTLFDCWNISRLVPGKTDDDKGYTNVLLHTEKAKQWLVKVEDALEHWETDVKTAERYDGIMIKNNVICPGKRNAFFSDMENISIDALGHRYAPIPLKTRLKEIAKRILQNLRIYKI